MADDITRYGGTSKAYKPDAGGAPVDPGPHIGIVKNTVDTARTGKIQVYIGLYGGPDENDPKYWKDLAYISPFYGYTNPQSPPTGSGGYVQNKHSYGMWFTPPDVGTKVICVFVNGDPNQGFYLGSVVNADAHHMVPAIGARQNYVDTGNPYFADSVQLPVVELNDANAGITDSPRFFDNERPIHQTQAFVLLQQGLLNDLIRGSIGSQSYRESPSTVYGISTPGRPIYDGGLTTEDLLTRLNEDADNPGSLPLNQLNVVGRQGGHSIVMDDGDISGVDQHVRFRTSKGHQILMSDSGDSLYLIHANGQSWIELGAEGTIDMYASNSINIRSGQINFHADAGININAGASINARSGGIFNIESKSLQLTGESSILAYSDKFVGIKSDGTLSLESEKAGTWEAGSQMTLSAGCLDLNGARAPSVPKTTLAPLQQLPDVAFETDVGWTVEQNKIETVATRVPTHEPWPFHSQGTNTRTNLDKAPANVPVAPALEAKLDEVQDTEINAISETDYETQDAVDKTVGTIKPDQVKAMLAQASAEVAQTFDEITNILGVGKYGFSAEQLETAGFLKPGVVDFYANELKENLSGILQSPAVWSGKESVQGLSDFLTDVKIQDLTQADLYDTGLKALRSTGLVTGLEAPEQLAGFVQASSKYPAATIKQWTENKPLDSTITTEIAKAVRGGQYSVELTNQKINNAVKGFSTESTGSTGTTSRTEVNESAKTVITTTKTNPPSYTTRTATGTTFVPAERARIQAQIDQITAQIRSDGAKFLQNNPGSNGGDWLRSAEYKALANRRRALQVEYNDAG